MEQALFWVFSVLAVASALGMVLNVRNTVNAALCLVVTLIAVAGLFLLLQAQFVGVLQIMVYAGAIVVLLLFVIMLLNLTGGAMGADAQPLVKLVGLGVVAAAAAKLVGILGASRTALPEAAPEFGSTAVFAELLYGDYLLVVQLSGVLLLAGIVAAVVMAKRSLD